MLFASCSYLCITAEIRWKLCLCDVWARWPMLQEAKNTCLNELIFLIIINSRLLNSALYLCHLILIYLQKKITISFGMSRIQNVFFFFHYRFFQIVCNHRSAQWRNTFKKQDKLKEAVLALYIIFKPLDVSLATLRPWLSSPRRDFDSQTGFQISEDTLYLRFAVLRQGSTN